MRVMANPAPTGRRRVHRSRIWTSGQGAAATQELCVAVVRYWPWDGMMRFGLLAGRAFYYCSGGGSGGQALRRSQKTPGLPCTDGWIAKRLTRPGRRFGVGQVRLAVVRARAAGTATAATLRPQLPAALAVATEFSTAWRTCIQGPPFQISAGLHRGPGLRPGERSARLAARPRPGTTTAADSVRRPGLKSRTALRTRAWQPWSGWHAGSPHRAHSRSSPGRCSLRSSRDGPDPDCCTGDCRRTCHTGRHSGA